jgi:hypothetical protein
MKKEEIVYIKTSASEYPDKTGEYDTPEGKLHWNGFNWQRPPLRAIYNPLYYMKPVPLSSLLQEGAHIYAYDILRINKPWSLKDILGKLIYAANHLLSKEDYDKHGWEEVSHALKEAEKVHNILESTHSDGLTKTISVQEGAVEFNEWCFGKYQQTGPNTWEEYAGFKEFTTTELFNSPEFKKHLEEKYGK